MRVRFAPIVTVLLGLLLTPTVAAGRTLDVAPTIRILEQSETVPANGVFHTFLEVRDAPAGAELAVDLYDPIDDVDQLDAALDGAPRDAQATYPVIPLAEAATPNQLSGFTIQIRSNGDTPVTNGEWSRILEDPGAHPVRIRLRDADGSELTHVVTFLQRLPDAGDPQARVDAAVILDLADPFASSTAPADRRRNIQELLEIADAHPDVPLGLDLSPDLARDLRGDPLTLVLLEALVARDDVEVLATTYVPIDPQQMIAEGSADDIHNQIELGRQALSNSIGRIGSGTWILRTAIDDETATILHRAGISQAIVTDSVIDSPATAGPVRLGAGTDVPAAIGSSLIPISGDAVDDPVLETMRAFTAGIERTRLDGRDSSTAILVGPTTDPAVLDTVLRRLDGTDPHLRAHRPTDLFGGGPFSAAALRPVTVDISDGYIEARQRAEDLHTSYRSMLRDDTPIDTAFTKELARTASIELTDRERIEQLDRIGDRIDEAFTAISTSESERLTLGTRDAHIPVAFTSTATEPLRVRVHLSAPDRLEFPDDVIEATILPKQRTVLQVPVRTHTSGDTPMTVRVTTPDDRIVIATSRYTIRSTAVSSVGLVLTIGAAGFLIVWWSRHILRSRRIRRADEARM